MVFVGVSPRIIGLLYLATLGIALGQNEKADKTPCEDTCIDVPYSNGGGSGRKLLRDSTDSVAPAQSLVPVLNNRRSLLEAMCSETDTSLEAIVHCTNAVRSSPSSFVYPCGKLNMNGGLGPLSMNEELMDAAEAHSKDNARMGDLTHYGSDGSRASTRVSRAGYAHGMVRENIAYGYISARSVVFGWMCSDGHRKNIMNCDTADIGVGVAKGHNGRNYHTQVFACPRDQRCTCGGGGEGGGQHSSEEEDEEKPVASPGHGGGYQDYPPYYQGPYEKPHQQPPYDGGYYDYHPYYGHGSGHGSGTSPSEEEEDEDEEGKPTHTDPYMMYGHGAGQGRGEGGMTDPYGMKFGKSKDGKHIYVVGGGDPTSMPHDGYHVSVSTLPGHGKYAYNGHSGN